ncbi:SDR family oxidoreductase [Nonomuraea dietziae]|uniref:SDR family oxidoreductase n=1 Tax=Nonomuraea dietziae TaxID=65515 RepID=UPI0031CEE612
MNILVIGATGAQGGAVARRLVDSGHTVRGLTRSGAGLPPGVTPVTGDLADASAVRAAFDGVTHACVVLPMVFEPSVVETYIRNIAEAAVAVGVRRLVYNTANRMPSVPTSVAAFETRRFATSVLVESGVETVVVRPPVYLDNLCAPWVAGPLAHEGVLRYPLPADLPVSWLSHADLATATIAALTRSTADLAVAPPTTAAVAAPLSPDGLVGALTPEGLALDLGGGRGGDGLRARRRLLRHPRPPDPVRRPGPRRVRGRPDPRPRRHHRRGGRLDVPLDRRARPRPVRPRPGALEKALAISLTPLSAWIAAQPWTELAR